MNTIRINSFWSKVNKNTSSTFYNGTRCWEWVASKSKSGYGRFKVGLRMMRSHRISWELINGEIPCGLRVLHHCDNRPCVNPSHLFLGSNQDNSDDMVRKGRQTYGERNGRSKLTNERVANIRERYATGGITQAELSREEKIGKSQIENIVNFKQWR